MADELANKPSKRPLEVASDDEPDQKAMRIAKYRKKKYRRLQKLASTHAVNKKKEEREERERIPRTMEATGTYGFKLDQLRSHDFVYDLSRKGSFLVTDGVLQKSWPGTKRNIIEQEADFTRTNLSLQTLRVLNK
ncbi:hypothetical protein CC78DRAFT_583951 [Lojkania enalia]|uniref:Uncharacterized protein n=1 Tax=Lojkania enalia TaxID=147567 RepID=A0A9P4K338_9PLEO|nr:hypothetical protein CC78DRAFT_583951 [Didymosphaeria enalia]